MTEPLQAFKTELQTLKMLVKREIANLEEQLEKNSGNKNFQRDPVWLRQIAASILAARSSIPENSSRIPLLNIKTGITEEIAINPKLTPEENAALFEKKAIKAEKLNGASASVQEPSRMRLTALQAALAKISVAHGDQDEATWQSTIASVGALVNYQPENAAPDAKSASIPPFRHYEKNGWHIYAGKTEDQNDELSIKFAAHADIWFHAAGCAGSHVIIRRPKGAPPPDEPIIRSAAAVAGWFSKSRNAPNVEIHFTEARFVHKRKNAPAGEVVLEKFSTLKVKPESPEMLFG